jgi:predicted cobalt transporter CbtA
MKPLFFSFHPSDAMTESLGLIFHLCRLQWTTLEPQLGFDVELPAMPALGTYSD